MGVFFRALSRGLVRAGMQVTKVNLNGGDELYFHDDNAIPYSGTLEAWPDWVGALMRERRIDAVFLFGDRRAYHRAAIEQARAQNIEVFVFEEGYLRPNYVTLERGGVNGRSQLSGDRAVHRRFTTLPPARVRPVGHVFWPATFTIAAYAWAAHLLAHRYPHYVHHRPLHPVREGALWIGGGLRKLRWGLRDRHKLTRFAGELSGRYFLVPLQVHNDFQILECGNFQSVEAFIRHVACEFVLHAARDQHLVFKHHPMDRAYRDYSALMESLAHDTGLDGRLHYVADLHLPTLLRHARGTVVVNSTVGLQSLHHGTPTYAAGEAPYTRANLAYKGELGDFFRDPGQVERDAVSAFETYLLHTCQLNGSFYKRSALPPVDEIPVRYLRAHTDGDTPGQLVADTPHPA